MKQEIRIYETLATEEQLNGAPQFCPRTGYQFWGWIDHPEKGPVPTYGGPLDTYTTPEKDADGNWHSERFDQDAGEWVEGGEPWPAESINEEPKAIQVIICCGARWDGRIKICPRCETVLTNTQ